MALITLDHIKDAQQKLKGIVVRTPTVVAGPLQKFLGFKAYLKLETLQLTGSFKPRGSYIKLLTLTEAQRKKGVIAASAGNHAQGVACHAHKIGTTAKIVMPMDTPFTKILRTEALGAEVILEGETLYESTDYAKKLCEQEGRIFIHPFDDPEIVKGQGTVGLEILEDVDDLDVIIVPIGGGGLMSGIATVIKTLKPSIKMIGVEADRYDSMYRAYHNNPEKVAAGQTIAEGIALKKPGELNAEICKKLVDDIVLVNEQEIEEALLLLLQQEKVLTEGAGAATTAAMLKLRPQLQDKKVCAVISGGNIDSGLLSNLLLRGLERHHQLTKIKVIANDAPGALARVSGVIAMAGGNIISIKHQRRNLSLHPKQVELNILLETRDEDQLKRTALALDEQGLKTTVVK